MVKFESLERSPGTPLQLFLADFGRASNKLKRHGITILDDFQGFKFLKVANLPTPHEQLIKATTTGVGYNNVTER